MYGLVQTKLKPSFKEAATGSTNGLTNADIWLAESESNQGVSPKGDQWSFYTELPSVTSSIKIDPEKGCWCFHLTFCKTMKLVL